MKPTREEIRKEESFSVLASWIDEFIFAPDDKLFYPPTRSENAIKLIQKMHKTGWAFSIEADDSVDDSFWVLFYKDDDDGVFSDQDFVLTVYKAALLAVLGNEQDETKLDSLRARYIIRKINVNGMNYSYL